MAKSKRERFTEIASGRVNRVISALQSLEKCSNTYNYEYDEDDVRKMFSAIKSQLDNVKMAYDKGLSKNKGKFKF